MTTTRQIMCLFGDLRAYIKENLNNLTETQKTEFYNEIYNLWVRLQIIKNEPL